MFSKVLDWIILRKEQSSLLSSELQFGFKNGLSTTQCTYSLLETIDYYNYNKSSVFVLLLDASKAFDRINYCKLFTDLLKRDVSPLVLRLLLHMYTNQTLCVRWGHALSNLFSVKNGVHQGGVLSPILFAICTDGLLKRLQETGVGCHMGHHFSGVLAYADDITLLSPSRSGMAILVKVCEKCAAEYDIIFNSKKSQLLHFRGRRCCTINKGIEINGQHVNISSSAVHLGHTISSVDRSKILKSAINNFWRHFTMFMSNFSSLSASMRNALFNQFCCSFYGSPLWLLTSGSVQSLCINWRKALRSLWKLSPRTHCDIITALSQNMPLIVNLEKRF